MAVPSPAVDEATQQDDASVEDLWASVQNYQVQLAREQNAECRLVKAPVLRWNNPVSGIKDGLVVMWVDATGKAAAAAQVFKTRTGYGLHEFQSLSEHRLTVKQETATIWNPDQGGVSLSTLPGPDPASSQAGRLLQMRRLAEQFDVAVRFKDDQADNSTTRYELRLLRQPIYRYEPLGPGLIDGAVFAYVQGTNPEALLILEAHKDDAGRLSWRYALAPMTAYEVTAQHNTVGSWQAENRQSMSKVPTEPFFIAHFEKPPRD